MGDEARFRHSAIGAHGSLIHVVEAGNITAAPFVFRHGWPESWSSWQQLMAAEVDDDLVRDVTEFLTSLCARLYGRRATANRARRAAAAVTGVLVR
jgi:pimeloyl-ACP methyl ester carboxylesterase